MIRTIAKHRYFKGKSAARSIGQYIGYVAFRGGVDAKVNGRAFFDGENEKIPSSQVKSMLSYEAGPGQSVLSHEFVFSPGVQTVDPIKYTRTLMGKLEKSLGLDMTWAAVAHKGKHNHIHVLIDAMDKNGRRVLFRKQEYKRLREWGDQYLSQHHNLERFLSREVNLDDPFEREKGDELYESLFEKPHSKHDLAIEEKKNFFKLWNKNKAIAELDDEEKIYHKGKAFHQFSDSNELGALLKFNRYALSFSEVKNIEAWLDEKRAFGDDHHERLAREAFAKQKSHRRKRKNETQSDKDSVHAPRKTTSVRPHQWDRSSDDVDSNGVVEKDVEVSQARSDGSLILDDENERMQLQKRDDERIAQLKQEAHELQEFIVSHEEEKHSLEIQNENPESHESLTGDIHDTDPAHHDNFIDALKEHKTNADLERRKVDLKIEQEQNTYLAQQDALALRKDSARLFKRAFKINRKRFSNLRRDLKDNNRRNKWPAAAPTPNECTEDSHGSEPANNYDRFELDTNDRDGLTQSKEVPADIQRDELFPSDQELQTPHRIAEQVGRDEPLETVDELLFGSPDRELEIERDDLPDEKPRNGIEQIRERFRENENDDWQR